MPKLLLCALLLCAAPAQAAFQAHRLDAEDLHQPLRVDGRLDHPAWQRAPVHANFHQTQPEDGLPAPLRTEVRVLADGRALFIGVRAFDPDPLAPRGGLARRDRLSNDQDYIGLFLDTAGQGQAAQVLYVNADGALSDGHHHPADGDNLLPDFPFEAATARFDGGWSLVVRLPYASLAYDAAQTSPWKLLVMRNLTRAQRQRFYSAPVARITHCVICQAEPLHIPGARPGGRHWQATVQAVASAHEERGGGQPTRRHDNSRLSLDLKLRPDSATILDATLRPDFSQVELDAAQLSGNTRFALFQPEKRPFFLESSEILQTPLRAIHTRTLAAPDWGLRLTRREQGQDLALLSGRDAGGGLVALPGAYGTAFRRQPASQASLVRALFKQGASSWGLLGSDRHYLGGRGHNRVLGADGLWQLAPSTRVRAQLLGSWSSAQPDAQDSLQRGRRRSGHAAFLTANTDQPQWSLAATLQDLSEGFRADNGFFSQVGVRDFSGLGIVKLGKGHLYNEFNAYLHVGRKTDRAGHVIQAEAFPGVWIGGPYDGELELHLKPRVAQRVQADGPLFRSTQWGGRIGLTPSAAVTRLQLEWTLGEQLDVLAGAVGRGALLSALGRWRPAPWAELELNLFANRIRSAGGAALLSDRAAQLRAVWHLGPRDSLRLIGQQGRTERPHSRGGQRVASLLFTHGVDAGLSWHLGLTDTRPQGQANQREAFLKLSWTEL